jgi:hypothetical protein
MIVDGPTPVAGAPDEGPRSIDDLTREVGAMPDLLRPVARDLAADDVLKERMDGRFVLHCDGGAAAPGRGAGLAPRVARFVEQRLTVAVAGLPHASPRAWPGGR